METKKTNIFAVALAALLVLGSTGAGSVSVPYHQKISDTNGDFTGVLSNTDGFGCATTVVGDLDSDGTADIAVGAAWDDDGGIDHGAVWILFMDSDATVKSHQKISDTTGGFTGSLHASNFFGGSVAGLGDLDGDGVPDLVVGAPEFGTGTGQVWILFLNADGTVKANQKITEGQGGFYGDLDVPDDFGVSVTLLGDLDGDYVNDIAVGARDDDDGGTDRGAVWILFLNTDGTVKAYQKISDTAGNFSGVLDNEDLFGHGVSAISDLNGDGIVDLAVGARNDDDGGTNRGAVWILFLDSDGTVKSSQKISDTAGGFEGTLDDENRFGWSVAKTDDLDGDGIPELAVGVACDDDGGASRGAVWILFLDADGAVWDYQKISDTEGGFTGTLDDYDHFGWSVAALVDFDGDGVSEIAVGADDDDDGGTDRGAVWILFLDVSAPGEGAAYYVDGVGGSDLNDGLTLETAFATVQKGVDTAQDADTVLVYPAVYGESINFKGKAITVRGVATPDGIAVIQTPSDFAVFFYNGEGPDSVLKNFVITNSEMAVFLAEASPTLSCLTVVENDFGFGAYGLSEPDIRNCIFYNNLDGDLYQCEAQYSWFPQEPNAPNMPAAGLVAHWAFDEGEGSTAYDSVGTNHGTLVNGPTWTTGLLEGALDFPGVDDYVDVGDTLKSELATQYTISAWFKRPSYSSSQTILAYRASGAGSVLFQFDSNLISQNLTFTVRDSAWNVAYGNYLVDLQTDRWYHIVGVRNGGNVDIYVDTELGTPDFNTFGVVAPDNFVIGAMKKADPSEKNFDGLIDEVAVYNQVLSGEHIQQLYQYGLSAGQQDDEPLFADAAAADYHLKSERGRYWPEHDVWVLDGVTSPCIDGGDPNVEPSDEPVPNGGRVNTGAYGNTPYAGMSEWVIPEDTNRDGVVNWLDFALLAGKWLEALGWAQ